MPPREGSQSGQPFVISPEELLRDFTVATEAEVKILRGESETEQKTPEAAEGKVSVERAKEILGTDFLGVEAVEKTFDIILEAKDVPPIPFTEADIENAKELGQFLILRVDNIPGAGPLSMEIVDMVLTPEFNNKTKGEVLNNPDVYKDEEFYKKETPTCGWALVSKENIPNSAGKNYLQQTQEIARYVETSIFTGDAPISEEYQDALSEYDQYFHTQFGGKGDLEIQTLLAGTNWKKYAQELADLKINQLTRQTPVDGLYDLVVYFEQNNRLLTSTYTWTNRQASDGQLVYVGFFDADGVGVYRNRPAFAPGTLGVSFSRTK